MGAAASSRSHRKPEPPEPKKKHKSRSIILAMRAARAVLSQECITCPADKPVGSFSPEVGEANQGQASATNVAWQLAGATASSGMRRWQLAAGGEQSGPPTGAKRRSRSIVLAMRAARQAYNQERITAPPAGGRLDELHDEMAPACPSLALIATSSCPQVCAKKTCQKTCVAPVVTLHPHSAVLGSHSGFSPNSHRPRRSSMFRSKRYGGAQHHAASRENGQLVRKQIASRS